MKVLTATLLTCALFFGIRCAPAQNAHVGTFDRRAIVIAYYSSPQWAAILKQKHADLQAAQIAHDQKKMDELNAWGGQSQKMAEEQVFGSAPITNIVEALQPAFAEIEKSSNLSGIVEAPASGVPAESVDVTDRLLDWLKASERTREIIRSLPQR
jgi:hypothetical protein